MNITKTMSADFASAAWETLVTLYARLLIAELNEKSEEWIYTFANAGIGEGEDSDTTFFLIRSSNNSSKTKIFPVARIFFMTSWIMESSDERELNLDIEFDSKVSSEKRLVARTVKQLLANLMAVYRVPYVKCEKKIIEPEKVPDPF